MFGKRFGRWDVLWEDGKGPRGETAWVCVCTCGSGKRKTLLGSVLRQGRSKSCGCLLLEGLATRDSVHRLRGHPLYDAWSRMKHRCYYEKHVFFNRYGGRGIKVCERWKDDFRAFYADNIERWVPGLTLDRIDNDGDYTPENTQWATRLQQSRNRSNTVMMTLHGETLPLVVWAEKTGLRPTVLRQRLISNWDDEKALTTPQAPFRPRRVIA